MTPHTLEEQKALLTAEAEGRTVMVVCSDGRRPLKVRGVWNFPIDRYEVERPLMEEWKVASYRGVTYGTFSSERDATNQLSYFAANYGSGAPFRVVHMKEVC